METPPNLQVYDLGHLGLVASVLDRIRLVETVDRLVGPRPGEKVSTGMALKAAILNALGFVASPLYLFGHPFQGKPTEHLLGPGVTPDLLNDDRMGRMLDTLYAAGVTEVFLEVAREARQAFPFPVQALHVDSTSFHVHGQYEGLGEEVGAIRVTYGYSRDHRPDLKQWVMNLVCADTGGIPPLFAPGDGNQSDREALAPLLARYRQALDLGAVVVLDGAGYSRENLRALEGFSWILRVPATLKEARALLEGEFPREAWTPLLPGYRGLEVEPDYGGVRQRWLLVESEARAREVDVEEEGLRRRVARAEGEAEKALGRLLSQRFACEADARRALSVDEEASGKLPYHRLVYLGGAGGAAPGAGGASPEGGGAPLGELPPPGPLGGGRGEAGAGEAGPGTLPPGHGRPRPGGPADRGGAEAVQGPDPNGGAGLPVSQRVVSRILWVKHGGRNGPRGAQEVDQGGDQPAHPGRGQGRHRAGVGRRDDRAPGCGLP
jgi:hypothetical protein